MIDDFSDRLKQIREDKKTLIKNVKNREKGEEKKQEKITGGATNTDSAIQVGKSIFNASISPIVQPVIEQLIGKIF